MNGDRLSPHPCLFLPQILFPSQVELEVGIKGRVESGLFFQTLSSSLIMINNELLLIMDSLAVPGIEATVANHRAVVPVLL